MADDVWKAGEQDARSRSGGTRLALYLIGGAAPLVALCVGGSQQQSTSWLWIGFVGMAVCAGWSGVLLARESDAGSRSILATALLFTSIANSPLFALVGASLAAFVFLAPEEYPPEISVAQLQTSVFVLAVWSLILGVSYFVATWVATTLGVQASRRGAFAGRPGLLGSYAGVLLMVAVGMAVGARAALDALLATLVLP
ncbi:MAG: hypothetical protein AAGA48_18875 [Myxococcota bacterium]